MTLEQFPFRDLVTPAGIAAAAVLIRQIIEMAKHSFLPWLDAGNERKGVFIISATLCAGWLFVYGTDLGRDGFAAVTAFWATATAAIGSNEVVDAAKGVVARNVRDVTAEDSMVSAVGTAAIDDSTDRSTSIERGPAVDLMVDGGEPADLLEERAADPAVAGTG